MKRTINSPQAGTVYTVLNDIDFSGQADVRKPVLPHTHLSEITGVM